MSRYHWARAVFDAPWPGNFAALPNLDLVIPAGAVVKRFVGCNFACIGVQTGIGYNTVGPFYLNQNVSIISGAYAPRILYESVRCIKSNTTGLYDYFTAQRVYTMYYNAGDEDLDFNQRCSYGSAAGATFTMRYASSLAMEVAGLSGTVNGRALGTFKALYYL